MSDAEMKIPGYGVLEIARATLVTGNRVQIELRVFSTHPKAIEILNKAFNKLDVRRSFTTDPGEVATVKMVLTRTGTRQYDKNHHDLKLLCCLIQPQVGYSTNHLVNIPGAKWNS